MDKQPTLVLIDGHALAYRAYFGMPATFTTKAGEPTHAVYGFLNMLLAVWHEYQPDYFMVTFDTGDTFRHKMYADYKATREKMPDDLRSQMKRIEQLVRAFNMPIFTKENYEADDLLGTLARQAAAQGIEALIVTGDRDAFQLVAPNIKVIISGKKFSERELYDESQVQERYGVTPTQLIELKGLVGDSSDNIPGVRGIGEKTGAKLIQQYGTLENIYEHLAELSENIKEKLETDRDKAFLSRKLGHIITDVPDVELNVQAGRTMDFDWVEVAKLFVELEFTTIFNRIPGAPVGKLPQDVVKESVVTEQLDFPPVSKPMTAITVDTPTKLAELVSKLQQSQRLAVDVETDSLDEIQANLVGVAITPTIGEGYYIPLRHGISAPTGQVSLFTATAEQSLAAQLTLAEVQPALSPILANPNITKYLHNAKFDLLVLERHGMAVHYPIFDTMIASWLTNNAPDAKHGLKELALKELNIKMTSIKTLIGSGKQQTTMSQVSIEEATHYAAGDVDATLRLAELMEQRLKSGDGRAWDIFQALELPLIYVLKDMELVGIKLDVAVLHQISKEVTAQLIELERKIQETVGHPFNVNSTQQLSDVLFKQLKLPTSGLKKNKSGHYSTAAEVLMELQGKHAIIDLMLAQRHLAKLKSTYVDALPELVNPKTQRLHTSYNQIGIATGRLSSSNPNLQNIPIRTEQGREIRRAFITEPGWKLIAADYSQVELRILAHIAEDPGLLQAFANDEDIHAATAAAVLAIPLAEVTKEQRRLAKSVNFGLVYGQTAFGLAQGTGMSQTEARQFIKTYFEKYPGVNRYIELTKKLAAAQGYITTLLGRRREFPGLAKMKEPIRSRVEREAINSPIQGTAADIMKQAMIDLHQALRQQQLKSRILLQVHDELVIEAPEDEVAVTVKLTNEIMSKAFPLKVPLKVDIEVGDNWLEMTGVIL